MYNKVLNSDIVSQSKPNTDIYMFELLCFILSLWNGAWELTRGSENNGVEYQSQWEFDMKNIVSERMRLKNRKYGMSGVKC